MPQFKGDQKGKSGGGEAPNRREKIMQELKNARAKLAKAKQVRFIAEHKVVAGDTLSGIALKHYKSAEKEKWMAIYAANEDIIGDNPSMIKPGQVLKIPELD